MSAGQRVCRSCKGKAVEYYETDEVKTLDINNSIDNHKRFQPHPSPIGATFPNLGEGFWFNKL